jgi:hypothetical protein
MFKYQIGEVDLDVGREERAEEAVINEAVHSENKGKRDVWKGCLVNTLARSMGCKAYTCSGLLGFKLQVVGVTSAVQTVAYLFGYLVLEINRLADEAYRAHGGGQSPRTYRNSFRMGAVSAIANRLAEQTKVQEEIVRAKRAATPTSTALALYKSDQERTEEAYTDLRKKLNLRSSGRSTYTNNRNAYQRGQEAGANLSLGGGKAIAGSKSRLGA